MPFLRCRLNVLVKSAPFFSSGASRFRGKDALHHFRNANAFLSGSICGRSEPLASLPFICRSLGDGGEQTEDVTGGAGADSGHSNDAGRSEVASRGSLVTTGTGIKMAEASGRFPFVGG